MTHCMTLSGDWFASSARRFRLDFARACCERAHGGRAFARGAARIRSWSVTRARARGRVSRSRLARSRESINHHSSSIARARASAMQMKITTGALTIEQSLVAAAIVDFGIQFLGWVVASALKTESFYDVLGSCAFASTVALTLGYSATDGRQVLISALALTWTARLGVFLGLRARRDGGDSRFDGVKENPKVFAVYWFLQGVWVWVTSIPVYLVNGTAGQSALGGADYALGAFWALGFAFELAADIQKYAFKSNKANKGRYIKHGLWSLSRHPNYFGEICMWFAIAGIACNGLAASHPARAVGAFASPLFVTLLITRMSGIPILEKTADERWGKEEGYQTYKKNTPVLVPKLPGM